MIKVSKKKRMEIGKYGLRHQYGSMIQKELDEVKDLEDLDRLAEKLHSRGFRK